ncbi:hypothetical protein [Sphingomonas sp. UYP23]
MLLVFALQAAVAVTPPGPPPSADPFGERAFAHFSREPLLSHVSESVDAAVTVNARSDAPIAYTLRLTRRQPSHPATIVWADSRTCPAVRSALMAMRAVTAPHPSVPGIDAPGAMVIDGTGYRLRAQAGYAHGRPAWIDLGSNRGTPLAAWVERSRGALARCWSAQPPPGPGNRVFLTP